MASSIRARARASAGTRRQYTTHHAPAPDTKIIIAATCCCILISFASAFSPPASGGGAGAVIISRGIISSSSLETSNAKRVAIKTSTSTQLYNKLGKDFDKSDLFPRDDFDKDEFLDDDDDDDNDDGIDYSKFDPAVAAQLRKAKQLLKESKKKVQEQAEARAKAAEEADIPGGVSQESPEKEGNTADAVLPFFASTSSQKIKSTTESGEIIADGETMANLSKSEAWEKRPLSQMFDKEARTDYDGNLVDDEINKNLLAEREIGIYNLRKALQNEDFRKVFDKRNRFIGDL